ncbi:MAG: hypothetical protein R3E89_15750 [Thiolinea sp.]
MFLDVVKLRAGQDWLNGLEQAIRSHEMFYLFLVAAGRPVAMGGKRMAAGAAASRPAGHQPVPLDEPKVAPPPTELASLHFNDAWLAYINTAGSAAKVRCYRYTASVGRCAGLLSNDIIR